MQAHTNQRLMCTLKDAMVITSLGRSTIYKLINERKLTPRKVGKRTLIEVKELEAFLNNLPVGGSAHDAK